MEDDDEYIDNPDFQTSIKQFAQIGFTPLGLGTSDVFGTDKKFDPKGHFKETVNAIIQKLREKEFRLNNDNIIQILDMTDNLKDPQYKNPTSYVLGYIASDGGVRITKATVNNVFKNILNKVDDKSVKEEDVLRYARLWYDLIRENRD